MTTLTDPQGAPQRSSRGNALVSIGMPIYNGEKYLRRALDLLLAQDYGRFELILSDNASTDETEAIGREYAARDSRIRYIRQPRNLGAHANFNVVLREAQGEYFMWAAVDDRWAPSFISRLLAALQDNPRGVCAFGPYQYVEATTDVVEANGQCNYEHPCTLFRLLKFTWYYRDACIYGLIRRQYMGDIRLEPWAWINSRTPYNVAYPLVYGLLAKGDFLSVSGEPLWFKSVRTRDWHATPFGASPLLGYLAHVVRKLNLLVRSMRYIYLGSKSALLVVAMLPFLLIRLLVDSITPVYAAIRIWLSGRKISDLSPHEIWQLGVR